MISCCLSLLEGKESGVWELNVEHAQVSYFSGPTIIDSGKRIFTLRTWRRAIHPEDRRHAAMVLAELLVDGGPHCSLDYRLRARDGSWQWLHVYGRVTEFDYRGSPALITGVCSLVSRRLRLSYRTVLGKTIAASD